MVDIEKFICSLSSLQFSPEEKEDIKYWCEMRNIYAPMKVALMAVRKALKEQGLEVRNYQIVPIQEEKSWSLEDAKPGDVIYLTEANGSIWYIIFKNIEESNLFDYCSYCVTTRSFYEESNSGWGSLKGITDFRLATENEKFVLFQALNNRGLCWNAAELKVINMLSKDVEAVTNEPERNSLPDATAFIKSKTEKFKYNLLANNDYSIQYIPVDGIVNAYQQGLEDMYNTLKKL